MKVMHVHWRIDSYGGGERYLHGICRSQIEAGSTVVTLSDRRFGADSPICFGDDARYLIESSMGVRTGLKEAGRVLKIVTTVSPDIVHLHHTSCLISPMILKGIIDRFPTVKTAHDASLLCPHEGDEVLKVRDGRICEHPSGIGCLANGCHPLSPGGLAGLARNVWERRVSRKIGKIIVGSRFMRDEYLRNSFAGGQVEILPLYVERPDRSGRDPVPTGADERTLLFVGRLDVTKGVFHFVEALHRLPSGNWDAGIVGDGPAFGEVERLIRRLGLSGRVTLHGKVPVERMGDFYRRAYLVAMPSLIPESFGLVGIEAMSFGKPVVAYDSGGIRDWLVTGETGYLVERGNIRALAEKMQHLLSDGGAAAAMGTRGRERADVLYRKEAHMKRLREIYVEAIDAWR